MDQEIGRRVREARGSMSQSELADRMTGGEVRWHQGTVTAVETGKRPLRFSEAIALASELGVSLDSLAGRPSITEDALRRWARDADQRLTNAVRVLQRAAGEIETRDPLSEPWEG